jgi:hypothetical protein
MSSASSVNDALTGYAAGRVTAEQLVGVVAAAYFGNGGQGLGPRERLKPLMEIIERVHPGVVELSGIGDRPGFAVRVAERPFPKRYEAEFRQRVQELLAGGFADVPRPQAPVPSPGVVARILGAIRRLFSA